MNIKNNYLLFLIPSTLLLLMFFFTNPNSLPVYFLILPFILIFILLLSIFNILVTKIFFLNRKSKIGRRKIITISSSLLLTILLALQSIGQLGIRDLLMVLILSTILIFYVNKASFAS